MKNLNKIKLHTNEKYKNQMSLKYCLSKIYYITKLIKLCKIEFHNYGKYTYVQLRGYLSFFLIGILLVVGISTILLGNDDDGINSIGLHITYAQLITSPNGYPEGHPLAPPQGYPDRYSERPSHSQVPPYFPQAPSHPQEPCQ